MLQTTRKGLRLHIGLFGRRNVGKSSLLNAFTRQQVSIVSDRAGTTTDPVEKPMELLPLGPVLFIDTAGIDDSGALGKLRIEKTRRVFDRTDLGIVVAEASEFGDFEEEIIHELRERNIPSVVVFNKADRARPAADLLAQLQRRDLSCVETDALNGRGIFDLRQAMLDAVPPEMLQTPDLLGDLVGPGEMAVMVVPIDKEAPKARLIVPQQQAIRNILDNDAYCMVVKEHDLHDALAGLNTPPVLVVTDSQAFQKVAAVTPPEIPMTSFSILFARLQGNLTEMVRGACTIKNLKTGDDVLIAEACSHHPIADDIGREKIPRWVQEYTGSSINFHHVQGHDFPHDIRPFKLIIHCGACMFNRREMLSRILFCNRAGVPITNYGLTIAFCLKIFERALTPFPGVLAACRSSA